MGAHLGGLGCKQATKKKMGTMKKEDGRIGWEGR
jgi:hypothetical protein